jgi:hypothetical protein
MATFFSNTGPMGTLSTYTMDELILLRTSAFQETILWYELCLWNDAFHTIWAFACYCRSAQGLLGVFMGQQQIQGRLAIGAWLVDKT